MQIDTVYQNLTAEQQLLLWEQGVCPGDEVCMIPKQRLHCSVMITANTAMVSAHASALLTDRNFPICRGMSNFQHGSLKHISRMCMPNHLHQISLKHVQYQDTAESCCNASHCLSSSTSECAQNASRQQSNMWNRSKRSTKG